MLTNHTADVEGRTRAGRIRAKGKRSQRDVRGKARILVVEDEIFVAWHLESVLRDLDYAVCGLVPDGETAVEKADQLEADLVLMDINLKGDIDGVEAARRIRLHAAAPIIFITAYSDAHTLARIEKAVPGAPVLAKPVAPQRLRTAIEDMLHSRH
jgi:CheY-like chemotaxis protein